MGLSTKNKVTFCVYIQDKEQHEMAEFKIVSCVIQCNAGHGTHGEESIFDW